MLNNFKSQYSFIFEDALLKEINLIAEYRKVKKGVTLIEIGDPLTNMPLIMNGSIQIKGEDKKGNEILLYYLEAGDSCTMTMTCCLGNKKSKIRAITEQLTELLLIPIGKMEDWLVKYPSWRTFVFSSYDARMNEMLEAIDTLAFLNMEERLYKYLRDKAMVLGTSTLSITHAQIAHDLNTSRVVISRLMKKIIIEGKVSTERNKVVLIEFLPKKISD